MKSRLTSIIAAASALLLASCATKMSNDPTAPSGPPDASLSVKIVQASYYGSASAGDGTLRYNGRSYPISVKALGGGGLGAQSIEATGKADKLAALLKVLEPFGIRELVKSGMVAVGRGSRSISDRAARSTNS
jgi:hypothetical protein